MSDITLLGFDPAGIGKEKAMSETILKSDSTPIHAVPAVKHWREMAEKAEAALTKISAIRDSIVAMQGFNFSEHAYPLVAALDEAGFEGAGYELAVENFGTMLERTKAAEAERDTALRERNQARAEHAESKRAWGKICNEQLARLASALSSLTRIRNMTGIGNEIEALSEIEDAAIEAIASLTSQPQEKAGAFSAETATEPRKDK